MLTKKDILSISAFLKYLQSFNQKTSFIYNDKNFSYKWLVKASRRMANWLIQNNYTEIMFTTKNSPLTLLLYLGGWLSSCKLYPVNPRLISHEIIKIIDQIKINILIVEQNQIDNKLIYYCSKYNITLRVINSPLEFIKNLPHNNNTPSAYTLKNQSITYHISSGTDGHYNHHGHTLSQILHYGYLRQFDIGLENNDKLLIALSLNHAYAFSYQFLPGLAMGLSLVLTPIFEPKIVKDIIHYHNITAIALLPAMYYLLCQLIKNDKKYNHCLRFLSIAGDLVQPFLVQIIKKTLGISIKNGIGMTEVYGYGQNTKNVMPVNKIKLFDEVQCKINHLPLTMMNTKKEKKTLGEIYLKTPTQPFQQSKEWLATGDLGYCDEKRYLYFFGRIKDIIVKGGSNISPIEIEYYLYQLPGIDEAIVIGKNNKIWGMTLCACIVTTDCKKSLTVDSINKHLSNYLASYKHIDKVYFMDVLPKNNMGKLDRNGLKKIINK